MDKEKENMKKVLDLHFNKEYIVKETEIFQGFWFPDGFHTFFNNLEDYGEWLKSMDDNEDEEMLQSYFDKQKIQYDFLPFEDYIKNEDLERLFNSYKFLWNSHDQSITPTKVFKKFTNYGVKQFGAQPKTFIIRWNEEHKFDECIPVKVLDDVDTI